MFEILEVIVVVFCFFLIFFSFEKYCRGSFYKSAYAMNQLHILPDHCVNQLNNLMGGPNIERTRCGRIYAEKLFW